MSSIESKITNESNYERQMLLTPQEDNHSKAENLVELFPEIVFQSSVMRNILQNVTKVAKSHSSVLILGESGTGKELIASAIHRLSPRSNKCFVAINCSAIPEDLLEAELFGHEKGAFTGADRSRIGHFGRANGGTIFLDEIGDMPFRLQSKLLRVLQEKKFSQIGSHVVKEVDVRILAATNIDLEQAVRQNTFRLDLYYRLNVFPITLPALKERSVDISLLLDHFINLSNRVHPYEKNCWFDESLKHTLCKYSWPGNIRQLQNLVERLVIMSGGGAIGVDALPEEYRIEKEPMQKVGFVDDVPAAPTTEVKPTQLPLHPKASSSSLELHERLPEQGLDLSKYIEGIENQLIIEALNRTKNNKNQAAKLLGLNRTTLVERIKKRKILSLQQPSKEL